MAEALGEHDGKQGPIITFVSPKGGTGKTVLAASTCYWLTKCGKRVLAVDGDFSTRGLSLYLLGSALESGMEIQDYNCLAEFVRGQISIDRVSPRLIMRDGLDFNILLSNQHLWRGGVPDEKLLGVTDPDDSGNTIEEEEGEGEISLAALYFRSLTELFEKFRREYDYIIVDTRGGYDFSSAVPAILSDGYVIILEADQVSLDQIHGFIKSVEEFAEGLNIISHLRGFIVNKALHTIDDRYFPEQLAKAHSATTFATIPFDRSCVRAYQVKDLPPTRYPESGFSYHSLKAVENLVAPKLNWSGADDSRREFSRLLDYTKAKWQARQRVEKMTDVSSFLQIGLFVFISLSYFLYRVFGADWALPGFYVLLMCYVLFSLGGASIASLRIMQHQELRSRWRTLIFGSFGVLWTVVLVVSVSDVPSAFSSKELVNRITSLDRNLRLETKEIASIESQIILNESQISQLRNDVLVTEAQREKSEEALHDARIIVDRVIKEKRGTVTDLAQARANSAALNDKRKLDQALSDELKTKVNLLEREASELRGELVEIAGMQEEMANTIRIAGVFSAACTYVMLQNRRGSSITLDGWRLSDSNGVTVHFTTDVRIREGSQVLVIFGKECDGGIMRSLKTLFVETYRASFVEGNGNTSDGGTMSLIDEEGLQEDVFRYGPKFAK